MPNKLGCTSHAATKPRKKYEQLQFFSIASSSLGGQLFKATAVGAIGRRTLSGGWMS